MPLAGIMLEERKNAIYLINKKYGLNIEVALSSVWKMQKEEVDKATETQDTETDTETDTDTDTKTDTETDTETDTKTDTDTDTDTDKGGK